MPVDYKGWTIHTADSLNMGVGLVALRFDEALEAATIRGIMRAVDQAATDPEDPDMSQPEYLPEPVHEGQRRCPHTILNRHGTECVRCGSLKQKGRWTYLRLDWYLYYVDGGSRPTT